MTYRGIVNGAQIQLEEPLPFKDGQSVDVSVEPVGDEAKPGSIADLLRVLRQPPHLTREDIAELEAAIESGKTPPTTTGIFDDME